MKFSYNWLKKISGTNKEAGELAEMVMLKGFELEEIENLGERFENFAVGEIKAIRSHQDADKLKVALLDVGKYGSEVQIVCGAGNIKEGQKVPVALPGAVLPQSKIKIEKTKIRGVRSAGMLCSQDELGTGKDASGIMLLDQNLAPGTNLAEALELKDLVLEFDILPNRAHDCLSYRGMAREIAAMEGRKIKKQTSDKKFSKLKKKGSSLEIKVEDKKLCPLYMGAVLENAAIKPSPFWMQARLIASGLEPINNVVDITNYVMLETGNPLHAFDLDRLDGDRAGKKIVIRKANEKEKLFLLDGSELNLSREDLVIADGKKALALAGIKGGKDSGISGETTRLVLEAANFNAYSIRKSRQRHAIQTDSQARFEKNISPLMAQSAMQRALELLEKYAGAKVTEVVEDSHFEKKEQVVDFDLKSVEKLLGREVNKKQAIKILENLGFELNMKNDSAGKAKVPFWRLDIESKHDLTEEIGRIIGYENIKPVSLKTEIEEPVRNLSRELEWKIKDVFSGLGFDEVINYSFYGDKDVQSGKIKGVHLELENPIASDQNLIRRTLLPGIIANAAFNRKNFSNFKLFEIGRIHGKEWENYETVRAGGVCFNKDLSREELFYEAKGDLEAALKYLTGKEATFHFLDREEENLLHPARSAFVYLDQEKIGKMGEAHPQVLERHKTKEPFCLFELDFDKIYNNISGKKVFKKIAKLPSAERDLAMFVDVQKTYAQVKEIIEKSGGEYLKSIELFDIYLNKKENKKSFAFHLEFYNPEKTLTSEEADKAVEKIIKRLENEGTEVRRNQ
ncbi:MAG: phenylalanine--tRNA ligase subunit beta [Candidatus Moranbacteria bacterium]|nr:phenylalanine--tRNA ligase subunit beta [Candidatus Moranbacteria bacterium]